VASLATATNISQIVRPGWNGGVSRAEILSALSFALDLTEGARHGHALRSCLLGMRIADELRFTPGRMANLYYALLLKDVGCSSTAARLCQIIGGGDERRVKAGVKLEDWTRPSRPKASTLRLLWNTVLPDAGIVRRTAGILHIGLRQHANNREMITLRCDHGAHILRKLGLEIIAVEAVRGLDEHWDGSGYPERRTRNEIRIESRILAIAQHLDVFATEQGSAAAMSVLRERSGRWFDPELVKVAEMMHREGRLWAAALPDTPASETRRAVLDFAPETAVELAAADVDLICAAFADVVDAKSSFTFRHSLGVTDAALGIAGRLGLNPERTQFVNRAALLHDIGKLRVPNSILDKPGKLDAEQWRIVREHPGLTREILSRIQQFEELAEIAGAHHEKLDGTGYPNRRVASELPLEARIIAVADVFSALIEDRPYRPGLPIEKVIEIMSREIPHKLDADCFEALLSSIF